MPGRRQTPRPQVHRLRSKSTLPTHRPPEPAHMPKLKRWRPAKHEQRSPPLNTKYELHSPKRAFQSYRRIVRQIDMGPPGKSSQIKYLMRMTMTGEGATRAPQSSNSHPNANQRYSADRFLAIRQTNRFRSHRQTCTAQFEGCIVRGKQRTECHPKNAGDFPLAQTPLANR